MSGPISRGLRAQIDAAIQPFPDRILDIVGHGFQPALAIKYVPTEFGGTYLTEGQKLWISPTPGFTWGRATYITTLAFPVSTAIFGRVGVVARFEPDNWTRTFDATDETNKRLYLSWLRAQPQYDKFVFTAQSTHFGHELRNMFREEFHIDCVLFRPDQSNPRYTDTGRDVWMAVTDWNLDGTIREGYSDHFISARLTALVEEEFKDENSGIHRSSLLNLGTPWLAADYSARLRAAYFAGDIERIPS